MAFSLADAVVYFKGDDSQLETAIDGAEKKTGSFVGNAGKLLGGALVGGAALAGAAIIGIGTAAFDVSTQTDAAANQMSASLRIPKEEAEAFADVARRVYGNNFADSVTDAASAVELLAKQMGLTAEDPALQTMAENAFRLRDTFGVDVADSIEAVKTLMDNFGISSTEAFDLLASGYQRGLDRSGDFLDTIGEYSVQFASGGASAEQFFGLLDSGLQGGVLGTDKAADAFKEFQVRIMDGSATTADSLALLGINSDEFTQKLSSGQMTVAQAFEEVIGKLQTTEDQATLMQAGVGLIGTQFEDLGRDASLALDLTEDWAEGTEGAITSLDTKYSSFGDAVGGIWRRLVTSISPFTDKLLELVNDAMPSVMAAFDTFDQTVVPAMENIGGVIDRVVQFVKGLFQNDMGPAVAGAQGVFDIFKTWLDQNMPLIQQTVETVTNAIKVAWEYVGPIIETVVTVAFNNIKTAIETTLSVILTAITLAMQLITGDFEGAAESLNTIVTTLWDGISTIFTNNLDGIKQLIERFDLADAGQAILDGLKQGIRDGWDDLVDWWGDRLQDLRDMLPFSEPKDPNSPLRNLAMAGRGVVEQVQKGLDEAGFSSGFLRPLATAAAGAGGASYGPISLVQNFYGPADPPAVKAASENGLRSVLRRRGE
jgi:phage-related minor tail protein